MVKQKKKSVSIWHELTEEDMLNNLRKEAPGKPCKGQHISAAAIKKVRRKYTNKTDWDVSRFDEWLVEIQQEGTIKMGENDYRTRDENARKLVKARALRMIHSHIYDRERTLTSVRKWMAKRGMWCLPQSGQGEGRNLATAAMVHTMEMNLKRKSTNEVGAALHILAAKGEIIVEDAKRGNGKGKRDWVQETMDWAKEENWLESEEEKEEYIKKAKKALITLDEFKKTCIELGSGWGGATAGLEEVFNVITVDMKQQKLKGGAKTTPDILTKFQSKKMGDLVKWTASHAGVDMTQLAAVWASPDCTEHTVAAGMNKNKKHAAGHHAGKETSKDTREGLQAVVEGIISARKAHPHLQYAIENPGQGALADERTPAGKYMLKRLGKPLEVFGCAYGRKDMKPYAIWMSREARAIFKKVLINPKHNNSQCEACKSGKAHPQTGVLPIGNPNNQKRVHEEGQTPSGAANRVPKDLAKQIADCMEEANEAYLCNHAGPWSKGE